MRRVIALCVGAFLTQTAAALPDQGLTQLLDPDSARYSCALGKTCYDLTITLKDFRIRNHSSEALGDEPYILPFFGIVDGSLDDLGRLQEGTSLRALTTDRTIGNLTITDREATTRLRYSTWSALEAAQYGEGWRQRNTDGLWLSPRNDIDADHVVSRGGFYFNRKISPMNGMSFSDFEGLWLAALFMEHDDASRNDINSMYNRLAEQFHRNLNQSFQNPSSIFNFETTNDAIIAAQLNNLEGAARGFASGGLVGAVIGYAKEIIDFTIDSIRNNEDDKMGTVNAMLKFNDILDRMRDSPDGVDINTYDLIEGPLRLGATLYDATFTIRLRPAVDDFGNPIIGEPPQDIACEEFVDYDNSDERAVSLFSRYHNQFVRGGIGANGSLGAYSARVPNNDEPSWEKFNIHVLSKASRHNPIVAIRSTFSDGRAARWVHATSEVHPLSSSVGNSCSTDGVALSRSLFEMIPAGGGSYAFKSVNTGKFVIVRSDGMLYANADGNPLGGNVPDAVRFEVDATHPYVAQASPVVQDASCEAATRDKFIDPQFRVHSIQNVANNRYLRNNSHWESPAYDQLGAIADDNRIGATSLRVPDREEVAEKYQLYQYRRLANGNPVVLIASTAGRRENPNGNGEIWHWVSVPTGSNDISRAHPLHNRSMSCRAPVLNVPLSMQFEYIEQGAGTFALKSLHNRSYVIKRSDNLLYANANALGGGAPDTLIFRLRGFDTNRFAAPEEDNGIVDFNYVPLPSKPAVDTQIHFEETPTWPVYSIKGDIKFDTNLPQPSTTNKYESASYFITDTYVDPDSVETDGKYQSTGSQETAPEKGATLINSK